MDQSKTFSVGGKLFAIPADKEQYFIKDMPDAQPVFVFESSGKKFGIPKEKVTEFMADMPEAKPIYDYPELKSPQQSKLSAYESLHSSLPYVFVDENNQNNNQVVQSLPESQQSVSYNENNLPEIGQEGFIDNVIPQQKSQQEQPLTYMQKELRARFPENYTNEQNPKVQPQNNVPKE